jgi:hypothetical protein
MTVEKRLAKSYYSLLSSIDWSDELLVRGLQEGLNKFLSNAYGNLFPRTNKYHRTHLVSDNALIQLKQNNYTDLVFEHLVPKSKYIQKPCENEAKRGTLTTNFIERKLERYWKTATITKKEDLALNTRNMPGDWDQVNVKARYERADIKLNPNPYFTHPDIFERIAKEKPTD